MSEKAPIIIKRKRVVVAGGHHGGAWKVAYADFVTAMMAFFLLMWLLNATTEEQRKGLADYFNPTLPIASTSAGGSEALNGDSILTEETLSQSAEYESRNNRRAPIPPKEAILAEIQRLAKESGIEDAESRIRVTVTEEGTVVELIDVEGRPLFGTGSAVPSEDLKLLIEAAANAVEKTGASLKIVGHTDGRRYASYLYSNFELSAERANAARRMLIEAGVDTALIKEVAGRADREPLTPDLNDPANRRIAIILLDPNTVAREQLR
jgi:chemotaxis protein MotB